MIFTDPQSGGVFLGVIHHRDLFNPLPNDKSLDVTNFEAFADDKIKVAKIRISLFERVDNTVEKGENDGYLHFLLFPQCIPKPSSLG